MELVSREYDVLGTKVWISVMGKKAEAEQSIEAAFSRAKEIELKYSRFIEGNVLADLNSRIGEWVNVDDETFKLLKFGDKLRKETDGVFDLSVKSILESWGYDENYSFKEHGDGSLGKIEFSDDGWVKLSAEIELGGIGKGYAVDEMAKVLEKFIGRAPRAARRPRTPRDITPWRDLSIGRYFINAGGDIFAKGLNEKGEKWRVYFEHPSDPEEVIGFVDMDETGMGLACTSPSKRSWSDKHHLVDPRTKKPADKMLAVYTQAENCSIADAYSTVLFVMGYDVAREKLVELPVEAMLIDVSGAIYRTEGFRGELFTQKKEAP